MQKKYWRILFHTPVELETAAEFNLIQERNIFSNFQDANLSPKE